jgi:uncharacterized membrane protein
MRGIYRFVKSTIIGGLVVLLPLAVLAGIIAWAADMTIRAFKPLWEWLPDQSVGGVSLTLLAAIGGLVALSFLAGLVAETALVKRFGGVTERLALSVPGYALMKNVGANFVGIEGKNAVKTVLVRFESSWQLGFLMDTLADGRCVVFIPGVPRALVGTLHIVARDRMEVVPMSVSAALDALGRLGVGLSSAAIITSR